jgi:hypothetical protein
MSSTPRFVMPRIDASQASQDVTHNTGLNIEDILMHLAVSSVATPVVTPPGSPIDGDTHIVGTFATGAWSGKDGKIAFYMQGWSFITPVEGVIAYGKDTDIIYTYNGSAWAAATASAVGIVPIGGVIAWLKSLGGTHTPALTAQFVECNGQTLSDAASPYNGDTIPNLNGASAGTKRFLRGSSTSGATATNETHTHTITSATISTCSGASSGINPVTSVTTPSGATSSLPSYYEVVYVLRIK